MDENPKINYDFSINLPQRSKKKGVEFVNEYGDNCLGLVWSPNCSEIFNPYNPPSGFSFAVDAGAPLISSIFSDEKMFSGVSIYQLENPQIKTEQLTEEFIIKNRSKFGNILNEKILDKSDNPFCISDRLEDNGWKESKAWNEDLGGGSSFAGIYVSNERSGYLPNNRLWLAVKSGNRDASKELFNMIEQTETTWDVSKSNPSKTTWSDFFGENSNASYIRHVVERSRHRILAKMIESLSINSIIKGDHFSKDKRNIVEPNVTTVSYDVDIHDNGTAVYHSGTVDPSFSKNGIAFCENPYLGITILKGPRSKTHEFGNEWKTVDTSFGSFPCNTGRRISLAGKSARSLIDKIPEKDQNIFFYSSKEKNARLAESVYGLRDKAFKDKEVSLGRSSKWGELNLKPLIVRICTE